ncbi:MAG TPA: protein-methionine-sulfoxide reductase heme-binding subunit MsrQ [Vicinamibacterales bacterium]|nr:protein-methionine-sulfoxide reductase heme-binding subunit MsrQ [Vicinamibacterales bacterium]
MKALSGWIDHVAGWRFFKPLVFVACLTPGAWLAVRSYQAFALGHELALGVDPVKTYEHETGLTALTILLITLSITPVRRLLQVNRLQRVRRMLGVWSFTYAFIHLCMYLVFDQSCYSLGTCEFHAIWEDLVKRRFIFVGMFAFTMLLALAITSTSGWVRRLKKNWQRLHRLAYVAAVAGIVHYIWIQKSDFREPFRFGFWLLVLFAIRIGLSIQKRRAHVAKPVTA